MVERNWEYGRPNPPSVDEELIRMSLALTPAQRLEWLETTVAEMSPWVGLATRAEVERNAKKKAPDEQALDSSLASDESGA